MVLEPALYDIGLVTNRDLLTVALRNLHENAAQHIKKGGSVKWSASCKETQIEIVVDDDGPGIPDSELPLVTERFFRGRYKSPYGSGLGLSIVQLALGKLGASLVLKNKSGGNGLIATLSLPQSTAVARRGIAAHAG